MSADSIVIEITPTSRLNSLSSRDVTIRFWSAGMENQRRINQTERFSITSKRERACDDDSPAPINPVLQARMGADVRFIPFSSLIFFLAAFLLATTGVLYLALKPTSQAVSKSTLSEVTQNNLPVQAAIVPIKMETEILPVVTTTATPSVSEEPLAIPTKRPRSKMKFNKLRSTSQDNSAGEPIAKEPPTPNLEIGNGEVKLDDNPY